MSLQRISYTELSKISKELTSLTTEIKNEINNIHKVVESLENDSGIRASLRDISLVDNVNKITSTFYNYNSIIDKFANFLDQEVIDGTQKVQSEIQLTAKKWESSLNKDNQNDDEL